MKAIIEFMISLYSRKEIANMAKFYIGHMEKQQRERLMVSYNINICIK